MTEQQMPARIWTDPQFSKNVSPNGECLDWTGSALPSGYGTFRRQYVHRLSYEEHVGPILPGLTIDHICKNTRCVNPNHLRMMPQKDNTLLGSSPPALNKKKTHCSNGHPYEGENFRVSSQRTGPRRKCRICDKEDKRRKRGSRLAVYQVQKQDCPENSHV